MIGFNRRFDPSFADVKRRIAAGEAGNVELVTILSRDPGPPPVSYIEGSGGLFRDMMIHDLDMARFLLGEEPVEVHAVGACLVDPAIGKAGDVDTAAVLLKTASGKIAQISNSRRATYGYDQRIEVHGSKGLIAAGNRHATTVTRATKPATSPTRHCTSSWNATPRHTAPNSMRSFRRARRQAGVAFRRGRAAGAAPRRRGDAIGTKRPDREAVRGDEMTDDFFLRNRGTRAVITGGSQGLGLAIAKRLAKEGAPSIVLAGRDAVKGEAAAAEVRAMGPECIFVSADVSKADDCYRLIDTAIETFGTVNGLVNAAALTSRGTLLDTTLDLWDEHMNTNARGPFLLMQRMVRHLVDTGAPGSIVNISSISAHCGQSYLTPYSVSKGALRCSPRTSPTRSRRTASAATASSSAGWTRRPRTRSSRNSTAASQAG
jgi:short-subunit dehydrogenase involved in D-alanine esterification of teichoic acids